MTNTLKVFGPIKRSAQAVLHHFHHHPTQNMVARELVGDVLPHLLIVRTHDELVDTATIQLSNTLFPIAAGYGLSAGYDRLQRTIQPLKSPRQRLWGQVVKAGAIYAMIATIPVANAFLRNWVTAKRTGSHAFIEMVGEKQSQAKQDKAHQDKLTGYQNRIKSIVGHGALASGLTFLVAQPFLKNPKPLGSIGKWFNQHMGLKHGSFEQFPLAAAALVWGIPIYAGLFSAHRDQFEFKELVLRFFGFLSAFFVVPRLAKHAALKWAPKAVLPVFKTKQNFAVLAEFVTTSVLCSVIPSFINIVLTHQRAVKAGLQSDKSQNPEYLLKNTQGKAIKSLV